MISIRSLSVSQKFWVVKIFFLAVLLLLSGVLLQSYKGELLHGEQVRLKNLVESAHGIIEHYYQLAQENPNISEIEAQELAKSALRDLRYEGGEYFFVYREDGINLVLGPKPALEGKSLLHLKDKNDVYFVKDLIEIAKKGGGFIHYQWQRSKDGDSVPKLSYSLFHPQWRWMIGTGVYIDDVDTKFMNHTYTVLGVLLASLLVLIPAILTIVRSVTKPLEALTRKMSWLTDGKTDFVVDYTDYKNEIGVMARTLEVSRNSAKEKRALEEAQKEAETRRIEERRQEMNNLAAQFEQRIGEIVSVVGGAAHDIEQMSVNLASTMEQANQQGTSVASSSEEASANVQTVAAATEQLSTSIQEIAANVSDTAGRARECAVSAKVSQEKLDVLKSAVSEIDAVIQAISDVAEQTNLLALNATIEAARAGEAGKGFAVVASEVKGLASQTHKMTDDIADKVVRIKQSSDDTIKAMNDILEQITSVDEKTTSVASAIEEQKASTSEISRGVQEASIGTTEVTRSVQGIQQAVNDSAAAAEQLKGEANSLSQQSDHLKSAVSNFVKEVRAA